MTTASPRERLLVTPAWLHEHLQDPGLRIIDTRPAEAYLAAHLPGARGLHDTWLKNPDDPVFVITPDQAREVFGLMGIDTAKNTPVIAYDDRGGVQAARLWWVLRLYGHDNCRLLDGGILAWQAEGYPVTTAVPMPIQRDFEPRFNPDVLADADYIAARLEDPGTIVWDTRRRDEYEGTALAGNPRGGHLPGARHLEWLELVDRGREWRFLSDEEIRARLDEAGITPDAEIVTHCQAAIRGAQAAFTLALVGYENVRVYDGSFADWSRRADLPLES